MKKVTEQEYRDNLDHFHDISEIETVVIVDEQGDPARVLMSYDVYAQLRKDNRRAMHISQLPEADLRTIANARIEDENSFLREELSVSEQQSGDDDKTDGEEDI